MHKLLLLLILITPLNADQKKKTAENIKLEDLAHKSYKVRKVAVSLLIEKTATMNYNEVALLFEKCVNTYKTTKDTEYKFNLKKLIAELYKPVYEPHVTNFVKSFKTGGKIEEYDFNKITYINKKYSVKALLNPKIVGEDDEETTYYYMEDEVTSLLERTFKEFLEFHKINIKEADDNGN